MYFFVSFKNTKEADEIQFIKKSSNSDIDKDGHLLLLVVPCFKVMLSCQMRKVICLIKILIPSQD